MQALCFSLGKLQSTLLGAEGALLLELGLLLFPELLVDLGALAGLVAVVLGLSCCQYIVEECSMGEMTYREGGILLALGDLLGLGGGLLLALGLTLELVGDGTLVLCIRYQHLVSGMVEGASHVNVLESLAL
jgi:hypothetical protein